MVAAKPGSKHGTRRTAKVRRRSFGITSRTRVCLSADRFEDLYNFRRCEHLEIGQKNVGPNSLLEEIREVMNLNHASMSCGIHFGVIDF